MDKNLIKRKIDNLRKEIEYHNKLYYDENTNIISDFEYDNKMKELIELENNHPEFKLSTSPSLKVGGTITKEFNSFRHEKKMLSLSNTYSEKE